MRRPRDPATEEAGEEAGTFDRHGIAARLLANHPPALPLWLVDARHPPRPSALALLSGAERDRAGRFRTRPLRDRYIAAHAALRLLGEHRYGIPASQQRWEAGALGKPRLADVPGAQCSLSYTATSALVGWAEGGEIGVDIEANRRIADAPELMRVYYTPAEQAERDRLEPGGRAFARAFLTVWVRKEACVKALGEGLSIPLDTVHCGTGSNDTPVQVGESLLDTGVIEPPGELLVAWARCRTAADAAAARTNRITSSVASRAEVPSE
jgi:4'-phosphopantetheinyl transferase